MQALTEDGGTLVHDYGPRSRSSKMRATAVTAPTMTGRIWGRYTCLVTAIRRDHTASPSAAHRLPTANDEASAVAWVKPDELTTYEHSPDAWSQTSGRGQTHN